MLTWCKAITRGGMLLALAGGLTLVAQPPADEATSGTTGRGDRAARMMERADTNKDGKISKDEFRGPAEMFDQLDTNKDGSISSDEASAGRDMWRNRGGGFGREWMMNRLKERLGATEEEWGVLQPQLQKVTDLQMRARPMMGGGRRGPGGGGPGGFGGGPGGGGPGGAGMPAQMPELEALSKVLDDGNASADTIEKAIATAREARKKNDEDLKTAREELRNMVTTKQEGVLVLMGILD